MRKIKIVHILNSVGGVDVSARLILKNLDSSKFKSYVIHGENDTDKPYFNNINEKVKDYQLPIQREISLFKDVKSVYQTIKIIKALKPDIIHAHSAKGGIVAKIVTTFLKIPVLHTPQAYSFLSASSVFKRNLYLFVEKLFVGPNNKILASSESEMKRAIKEVGYKPKNVLLFNNSINPIKELKPLQIEKVWPDNYICSVGRPSFQKNIELMLDVLSLIKNKKKNIHLVLMGVGYHSPNLDNVKRKINALNLQKNITLLEWTSREDIFSIIKESQLYLTTARYEGLPYSVIESLALSRAVVATDADGNRDLVKDNFNGFLIENEDINKLANSVLQIIESKEKREKFSSNSLVLFNKKFNIVKNITNLESIYRSQLTHD
jgi:glycosyltransferase involved in cell wall biosynthesis